ncbi:hypothetical protein [Wenzhouxiangella marina]|uniref:Uncharacterized protein n=1 Tax=Wenzhouxiangella marina TaxID=1579979 RepID=A0A0K0XYT6_9GAMM|nr:hypothetical protein [Wenzhouxiangella marina]AKS42848.1 hypothetical protein WM2015_2489 [Wenzhouxiangella marina]MBB6087471.1 hypothetical protein [Wenzhouxiangella marina]
MPQRSSARSQKLRQSIAAEAARIMATEGQRSYLLAKQKAAERLGASTRNGLPSNAEVEDELKTWQQLYGGEELKEALENLRREAAAAMRFLDDFRPRLVGPVAEGTADQFSRVCLQVFSDDPDAVVRYLMENHIAFDQERRRVRWHDGKPRTVDVLVVDRRGTLVEMMLMIGRDALQPLPSPIDGRPQLRLALSEVEALLKPSGMPPMPPPRGGH